MVAIHTENLNITSKHHHGGTIIQKLPPIDDVDMGDGGKGLHRRLVRDEHLTAPDHECDLIN